MNEKKKCKSWGCPVMFRGPKKQEYCSKQCRLKHQACLKKQDRPEWQANISKSLTGMIGEFTVVIDLIKKGYEPCTPIRSNAPFDILILKEKQALRIEVKTAHRDIKGKVTSPVPRNKENYDVLAEVIHEENTIVYSPDIL